MAASGRSLKPFYLALALVAAAGLGLIARSVGRKGPSASSSAPLAPLAAGPRGVPLGSDSAPVEIAEYSDFECPYCARFAILQMPDVKQRLIATGLVRWRFLHFPLEGHANSPPAHLAAACAGEQGRFWEMHDAIYAGQAGWAAARRAERAFREYAARLGLDQEQYASCVRERRAWPSVEADRRLGDSLGVNATPTFFVNGRQLASVPSFDQLKAIVDSIVATQPGGRAAPRL